MKIAIVDDFINDLSNITQLISCYMEKQCIQAEISVFDSGKLFLQKYQPNKYQIVILDIYINESNGMHIARYLRQSKDKAKILFTTFSKEFAVESYEVGAVYYLLKPIVQDKLYHALDLCICEEKKENAYVEVISNRLPVRIPVSNIYSAETLRNILNINLKDTTIKTYTTFQAFMELLNHDSRFLICCKGCVVNMDHIAQIDKEDFIMENGQRVQIRRRGGNKIRMEYLQYMCSKTEK